MALPNNVLSSSPIPSRFFGARSLAVTETIDYEEGGIALNDPSQGLLYQRWKCRLFNSGKPDSYVELSADRIAPFVWLTVPYMTEISFSFDANMRAVVTYVASDRAYLNWYDSAAAAYVTTPLAVDIVSPRVAMDDKRPVASNGFQVSDVILGYVRGNSLYYRQQRDRYQTERFLTNITPGKKLVKIGLGRGLRFQFMVEP